MNLHQNLNDYYALIVITGPLSDFFSNIHSITYKILNEQAASLAEKYLEFSALVRICEETGNKDKLDEYIRNIFNLIL